MASVDTRERENILAEMQARCFDLVIVGGGITGAGILREASLRGLSVALLEASDFAAGTSSKSTKLVHGGIRYLAMGHVHIVREAARERKRVHELAPHLAEPQWLMLPARNYLEFLRYRAGVNIYEWLGQVEESDIHRNLGGHELAEREPLLDTAKYPRACVYREYLTDDARLVMANIRAGVRAGGLALNRMQVTGVIKDNSRVTAVRACCGVTGEEIIVQGRAVVNAAGPWVESICDLDGLPSEKPLVLSKGVHVVIPYEKLPLRQMVLLVAEDRRPVFVIPRGDVVYIGTTDSRYGKEPDIWPEVERDELIYLFSPVREYFGVSLTLDDCLVTWAGLRPLISQRGKSTKEISRKDEIWVSRSGLVTIAGGKLTGYRKMAEDTVDKVVELTGFTADKVAGDTPLPGGDFAGEVSVFVSDLAKEFSIEPDAALRLVRLYGTEARDVLASGPGILGNGSHVRRGEILWAVTTEGAVCLEDVIYRRTRAAYYRPQEVAGLIEPVSLLMAELLGWTDEKRAQESALVRERFARDTQVR